MATKVTLWRPDTCGCVLEYSWDDTQPQDQRTHDLHRVERKCPAHSALADPAVYAAITDENPRKNRAISRLTEDNPALFPTPAELMLASGSTSAQIAVLEPQVPGLHRRDFDGQWSFDPDRNLVLTLPSRVSVVDRARITTELRSRVSTKIRVL